MMYRPFMYLIFVAFCLSFVSTGAARADLVGWWKLDEGSGTTTYDSSGNGNHGTLTEGTAGFPEWKTAIGILLVIARWPKSFATSCPSRRCCIREGLST